MSSKVVIQDTASVVGTGGEVDGMVMALIERASDPSPDVRPIVHTSLIDIGRERPLLVLSSCETYLHMHKKLEMKHRVILLQIMREVVTQCADAIPQKLAMRVVKLAAEEMTSHQEIIPEWQSSASALIVSLGNIFGKSVLEQVKLMIVPNTIPHYFVVKTVGDFSKSNPFAVVPELAEIFGRLLTVTGSIRHDNLRWVFADSFARFSEAVLDYVANIESEKATDKTITVSRFSHSVYSAYEILQNVWLQSKEEKLRFAVVEALGLMSQLLTHDKLESVIPQIIPAMLALFKRPTADMRPLTAGLCTILDAATKAGDTMLDAQRDEILNTLFPFLASQPAPTMADQNALRNYTELLRCFEKLCRAFPDALLGYVFMRMDAPDERPKLGGLSVLRHLINACDAELDTKKEMVVNGLKPFLVQPTLQVAQAIIGVIGAMAHHDYLSLDGGDILVRFLVQYSSNSGGQMQPRDPKKQNPNDPTPLQLRSQCDNILIISAKTIQCMEQVLWPYLLEFIVPMQYLEATSTICQALTVMANRLAEDEENDTYDIDFTIEVNLPRPQQLLAKLLVVIAHPLHRNRGREALLLLQAISVLIHENVEDLWDDIVPKLTSYYTTNSGNQAEWISEKQQSWEDLLLKFLSKTMDAIDDEAWILQLGEAFAEQQGMFTGLDDFKNINSKYSGVVLRKCTKRDFIEEHLEKLFMAVNHTSQVQREGCAKGFGFAASSHLDSVIEVLNRVAKREMTRNPTGFLGLMKDKSELEVARVKATAMLTYGYVTFYAPPSMVVSRIEVNILAAILPNLGNAKFNEVKENLVRCVELVGKALHPSHLKNETVVLQRRGELLDHMQKMIAGENPQVVGTRLRALCFDACKSLVDLQPPLSEANLSTLIDVATSRVFDLAPPPTPEDPAQQLIDNARASYSNLLCVVIAMDSTASCVQSVFKHLAQYLVSDDVHQRECMLVSYKSMLETFLRRLRNGCEDGKDYGAVDGFGGFVADVAPRCTDPSANVRTLALGIIQILLQIQQTYAGQKSQEDAMINAFPTLQQRAEDASQSSAVVSDLAKVLSKKVRKDQLVDFVFRLMEGLLDARAESAIGCCVILKGVFKNRGTELEEEVDAIVDVLHQKLSAITEERTRNGILRVLRTLAVHHLSIVVKKLQLFDTPYDSHVVDMWHAIAADDKLVPSIVTDLLEVFDSSVPYAAPQSGPRGAATATVKATCALSEVFAVEQTQSYALDEFPNIVVHILARCASAATIAPAPNCNPAQDAIRCLQVFFERSECQAIAAVVEGLSGGWSLLENPDTNHEAFTAIAAGLCNHKGSEIGRIVSCLDFSLKRIYEGERAVAVALFAEFLNQKCAGDLSLVNALRNGLLGKIVDSSHVVRMLCMRGLGNVASLPDEHIRKHSTAVLSALTAGMDDRNDPNDDITLEAMRALNKVFKKVDENTIRSILINISIQIRPCFEKQKPEVRAASMELFGNLSRFGDGPSRQPFLEQVHANIISFILHSKEADESVCTAAKKSLILLGSLLESENMLKVFNKHFKSQDMHFGEFVNGLTRVLIEEFGDKVSFYSMSTVDSFFKSDWAEIRANAAIFSGFLLGNLPKEKRRDITKQHVCGELIRLLQDPSADVRSKAAEAMSLLYSY
eukprot:m.7920 g.7920  ORF g.7920 m.7920 type:complete len:1638 (-) comp5302_c0_seq1:139-5052(-)